MLIVVGGRGHGGSGIFFLWEGLAGNNVKMQCGSFRGIYVETSAVKDS